MKNSDTLKTILGALISITCAQAADWNVSSGDWATPGNWSTGAVPVGANTAHVAFNTGDTRTATYSTQADFTTTGRFIAGLGTGTGIITLNGSAGTLTFGGNDLNNANYIGVDGGTGTVTVSAGTLRITSGALRIGSNAAGSNGTLNIGGTGKVQVDNRFILVGNGNTGAIVNSGTLNISGGSLTTSGSLGFLAFGRTAATFGYGVQTGGAVNISTDFTVGTQGKGTYLMSNGTLTVGNSLFVGGEGYATATGYFRQSGNTDVTATNLLIGHGNGAVGTYQLDEGTLHTNTITLHNTNGTFLWGDATLTMRQEKSGSAGATDYTIPAISSGVQVRNGTTITVTGSLQSGFGGTSSSVLDLGSPYLSGGVLFDNLVASGSVDLAGTNDTLLFEFNPYFFRPQALGVNDYGSLPLVIANGGLSGEFENIFGVVDDGRGFTQAASFTNVASLESNTWYLEHDTANNTIWFHYNVAGSVPEPSSLGLLLVGGLFIRNLRRKKSA